MDWIISAHRKYDHARSFEHYGFIDWKQVNPNYKIGDLVYIYCSKPIQKIRYKCRIEAIDLDHNSIRDDKEYWYNIADYWKDYWDSLSLKFMRLILIEQIDNEKLNLSNLISNGLSIAPRGPVRSSEQLSNYINSNFSDSNLNGIFPDSIDATINAYEGLKKQVIVNKYERSSIARAECIKYNGSKCKVCETTFTKVYGAIGEGFIHVHHIIPIHSIGQEYKIDYKNDLIPVCPNCHAMLHKKIDGNFLSVEKLREIVEENNKLTLNSDAEG